MRKILVVMALTGMLSLGAAAPAMAQGNRAGDTLVNVQISDVTVLIPVSVAANLCDINVNVLADQVRTGDTDCEATAESVASPGPGGGGGGNRAGDSLVNVQISDVDVFVPIGIAANLCDVNANILAKQLRTGDATCTATAESIAS
jgi:hypothetical protein